VTNIHLVRIFVEYKFLVFLIVGVILQVHLQVIEVAASRKSVFNGCKSHQSFFVQVNFEGMAAFKQDIKSQFKLQAVYQVGANTCNPMPRIERCC